MKIAIVTHNVIKNDGQGRSIYELVKYLSNKGHDIHLYINRIDRNLLDKSNIIVHHIPTFFDKPTLLRCLVFYVIATLKLLYKKYDIIHLNGGVCYTPYHVNTCHFCHTAWRKIRLEKCVYHRFYTLFNSWLEKLSYKYNRRAKIIAVSNKIKSELINLVNIEPQKINVIYYGVDLEEFNPDGREDTRRKLLKLFNLDETDFILLFVGDLGRRKGLDWLLAAIPKLEPNVKLLIAGRRKKFYTKMVKEYNIEHKVIFLGFKQDINKIYKVADTFVFPSLYDPFPNVVLEAMACSLPVIVSRFAGSSEIITDRKDGMILENPTNLSEIINKVNFLSHNEAVCVSIGSEASKTVSKYSWNKMAEAIEEVYYKIKE
ncbi:MAG: glycosyltransferase family 4 protein [bacterium]|nr:glycosyltransferase family 4 protein [bacterium]